MVVVGNLGTTYLGSSMKTALEHYREYRQQSKAGCGRVAGENVTLLRNNEILKEYVGAISQNQVSTDHQPG